MIPILCQTFCERIVVTTQPTTAPKSKNTEIFLIFFYLFILPAVCIRPIWPQTLLAPQLAASADDMGKPVLASYPGSFDS
jgi:hypothetical protein